MFPYRHRYKYTHTYTHTHIERTNFYISCFLYCLATVLSFLAAQGVVVVSPIIFNLPCIRFVNIPLHLPLPSLLLLLSIPFILYILLTLALYYARPTICVPEIPTWPKALPTSCTHTHTSRDAPIHTYTATH